MTRLDLPGNAENGEIALEGPILESGYEKAAEKACFPRPNPDNLPTNLLWNRSDVVSFLRPPQREGDSVIAALKANHRRSDDLAATSPNLFPALSLSLATLTVLAEVIGRVAALGAAENQHPPPCA